MVQIYGNTSCRVVNRMLIGVKFVLILKFESFSSVCGDFSSIFAEKILT